MSDQCPFFVPVTVMVMDVPARLNAECMSADVFPAEAVEKIDEFCHRRLGIPVNWLVCRDSVKRLKEKLRQWHEEYGDEVGVFEWGIYGGMVAGGGVQSWVEELGMSRPAQDFLRPWHDLSEQEATTALAFLKAEFERELGFPVTLAFGANGGDAMVRALKATGFRVMWGYNWNLYGDGVDATGRGSLPDPFFVNSLHAKIPAEPGDTSLLGVPWGAGDYCNIWQLVRQCRLAVNNVCLNPHELANRSGALDQHDYVEKLFARAAAEHWNPYRYVPLQCEAVWLDESGDFYRHHPDFPTRTVETFFHEIETALRHGARCVGFGEFRDWMAAHFDRTPTMVHLCRDLLPDTRIRGKDQAFSEVVLFGGSEKQLIFEKSHGFNPVRSYSYVPARSGLPPGGEYPGEGEPEVELKVLEWTSPSFGVSLSAEGARYEAAYLGIPGFSLTAGRDYPNYHCLMWHFNLPDYIAPEELSCSDNIRSIDPIREGNLALIRADLRRGDNRLCWSSDLVSRHLHVETPRRRGRRFEIYLYNDASPVGVTALEVQLTPGLQLGGFWWDGKYYDSIYFFNYSPYDWRSGKLKLFTAYPDALPLRRGMTRCSFEILGEFDLAETYWNTEEIHG